MLRTAESALSATFGDTPIIQHPFIATWREAYRKFGAKPKDYPSSVENLARRVLNGARIAHINNLVSLYNTISLRYILPVGAICRRWNWKEADRTKLTKETCNAFLVIEALPPVTRDIVHTAIYELADLVRQYCGGVVSTAFLSKEIGYGPLCRIYSLTSTL